MRDLKSTYVVEIETPDGQRHTHNCNSHEQIVAEAREYPDGSIVHVEVPSQSIGYQFVVSGGLIY